MDFFAQLCTLQRLKHCANSHPATLFVGTNYKTFIALDNQQGYCALYKDHISVFLKSITPEIQKHPFAFQFYSQKFLEYQILNTLSNTNCFLSRTFQFVRFMLCVFLFGFKNQLCSCKFMCSFLKILISGCRLAVYKFKYCSAARIAFLLQFAMNIMTKCVNHVDS